MKLNDLKREVKLNWTCDEGLITLNPSKDYNCANGNYGGDENQLMWTGIYYSLIYMVDGRKIPKGGNLSQCDYENVANALYGVQASIDGRKIPGLYSRHRDPYRFTEEHHGISHDEMNGITWLSMIFNMDIGKEIARYGRANSWAYIDERPNLDPVDYARSIKRMFKKPTENTKLYLSRIRQPRDRALYKISGGLNPSMLEFSHLLFTAWLTSRKDRTVTSGKILAFFRFQILISFMKNSILKWLLKKTYNVFRNNLKKTHGEYFMEDIFNIFFKHKNHPFHKLINLCRNKY